MNSAIGDRQLFDIRDVCTRWGGLSPHSVRRHIKAGRIRTVHIGARIFIPLNEIMRVESEGIGQPRARRSAKVRQ
ncbi:MAG TPA: hypothetical protein VMW54_14670 [Terriglobia bacterium]|nr:hypothetical protein [Terriglobia bacterium]